MIIITLRRLTLFLTKLKTYLAATYQVVGSYVTTSTTVNGHALTANVTVTKSDVDLGNVDNTADADKTVKSAGTCTGNAATTTKLATARTIDGVSFDGTAAIAHFGTCSTAAGTAAKTVAITGFALVNGARAIIKFTTTNTTSTTLNINSTGAKNLYYNNTAATANLIKENHTYEVVYDGTQYQLVGDIDTNTTYTLSGLSGIGTIKSANTNVLTVSQSDTTATLSPVMTTTATSGSSSLITSGAVYKGLAAKVDSSLIGVASGVASLGTDGKVPSSQLPSYVDDVIEGTVSTDFKTFTPSTNTVGSAGEAGKIYVDLDTLKTYRWSGSQYVEVSASLALGETSSTAYAGDKGATLAATVAAMTECTEDEIDALFE